MNNSFIVVSVFIASIFVSFYLGNQAGISATEIKFKQQIISLSQQYEAEKNKLQADYAITKEKIVTKYIYAKERNYATKESAININVDNYYWRLYNSTATLHPTSSAVLH
jgi:hypothetical protein